MKRITKKQIIEATIAMDMDTYKKEKSNLEKDDTVVIRDKEGVISEDEALMEEFLTILKKNNG